MGWRKSSDISIIEEVIDVAGQRWFEADSPTPQRSAEPFRQAQGPEHKAEGLTSKPLSDSAELVAGRVGEREPWGTARVWRHRRGHPTIGARSARKAD